MNDTIKKTIALFGEKDPGGDCWQWIISNHSRLWHDHQAAVRDSKLAVMATTFKTMLSAWQEHRLKGCCFKRPGITTEATGLF